MESSGCERREQARAAAAVETTAALVNKQVCARVAQLNEQRLQELFGLEELEVAKRNPLRRAQLAREQEGASGTCAHDHPDGLRPEDHFYKDIAHMHPVKKYIEEGTCSI